MNDESELAIVLTGLSLRASQVSMQPSSITARKRITHQLAGHPQRLQGREPHRLALVAGTSRWAIRDGRSIDTTMASLLRRIVMATRSGSVDPGMLLRLLERGMVGLHRLARISGGGGVIQVVWSSPRGQWACV